LNIGKAKFGIAHS